MEAASKWGHWLEYVRKQNKLNLSRGLTLAAYVYLSVTYRKAPKNVLYTNNLI